MKGDEIELSAKGQRGKFNELGAKILSAPKAEVDRREAIWQASRPKAKKRKSKP